MLGMGIKLVGGLCLLVFLLILFCLLVVALAVMVGYLYIWVTGPRNELAQLKREIAEADYCKGEEMSRREEEMF